MWHSGLSGDDKPVIAIASGGETIATDPGFLGSSARSQM
jgi:hypothetical protein